jgi:hypothetical protein
LFIHFAAKTKDGSWPIVNIGMPLDEPLPTMGFEDALMTGGEFVRYLPGPPRGMLNTVSSLYDGGVCQTFFSIWQLENQYILNSSTSGALSVVQLGIRGNPCLLLVKDKDNAALQGISSLILLPPGAIARHLSCWRRSFQVCESGMESSRCSSSDII